MRQEKRRTVCGWLWVAGFSLIEVNMAVFVMAIGILSMVALYPLGLRESMQGTADLKQASLADYYLNQVVAIASMTNFPWSQWRNLPDAAGGTGTIKLRGSLPPFIKDRMADEDGGGFHEDETKFTIGCCRIPGHSDRLMGILVQCTDQKNVSGYNQYSNNPVYYAEVYFRGDPTK